MNDVSPFCFFEGGDDGLSVGAAELSSCLAAAKWAARFFLEGLAVGVPLGVTSGATPADAGAVTRGIAPLGGGGKRPESSTCLIPLGAFALCALDTSASLHTGSDML